MNKSNSFLFFILILITMAFSGNANTETISFSKEKFENVIETMSRITELDEYKEFYDYAGSSFSVDFKIEDGVDILTLSTRGSCSNVALVTKTSYRLVDSGRGPFRRKFLGAFDEVEFTKEKAPCRAH